MLEALLNHLRRRPGLTLLVAALVGAAGAWQCTRLSINDSAERWMPRSAIEGWERFAAHFEYGDTIAFGLQFHDGVRDEDIEYLKGMRAALDDVEGVMRVTDLSIFAELVEAATLTQMLAEPPAGGEDPFAIYRGVLYDDPRAWRRGVLADDTSRTLLMVAEIDAEMAPSLSPGAAQAMQDARRRRALGEMYEIMERFRRDDVTIHPAGSVVIQYELEQIAGRALLMFVPLSVVLTLLALGAGFSSWRAAAVALLGGAWACVVMLGGVAAAGWSLNVVTMGSPVLVLVMIVATTVHFAHYYAYKHDPREGLNGAATPLPLSEGPGKGQAPIHRQGNDKHGASGDLGAHFVRWVVVPCFGAAMTTGVGFLMLTFNELQPVREMGVELLAGSLLAVAGAYLMWLLLGRLHASPGRLLSRRRLGRFEQRITRRPKLLIAVMTVLLAGLAAATTRVRVDADPFAFFQDDSYVARALTHFTQRRFGHYMLDVILIPNERADDGAAPAAQRRRNLAHAAAVEDAIRQRPEVRRVISESYVQTRITELERKEQEARAAGQVLTAVAYAVRRGYLKDAFKNWLVDQQDRGAMRITFMVYDRGDGFAPLVSAVRDEIAKLPQGRFDHFFTGTVASVVVLSQELVGAMQAGLVAAMLAMAALCIVLFRSVRLTLIAFLPNAFPIVMVFGVMGLFEVPLNSGSAMVATIALGIGLNDTVHFVMHYRRRRLMGESLDAALFDTFAEIGRPIVLTSIVACAGFGIFLLAEFQPLRHFGLLAGVAMLAALVGDLVLLPNLLKVFGRRVYATASQRQPRA